MTAVDNLKGLRDFVEKEVANTFRLRKEALSTEEPEFVHPYVALISLPHKNFMPVDFQVPYILIGMVNDNDAADEHTLSIRMQFATFGGEVMFNDWAVRIPTGIPQEAMAAKIPDSSGYIDLLNLMERTKERLINHPVIKGGGIAVKPFTSGIYDEQVTYPYWYGYMTFDLQIPVTQRQMLEFL